MSGTVVSESIKAVFSLKQQSGKFIGSFASYGYAKDPNDKNKLVIDKEAAEVLNFYEYLKQKKQKEFQKERDSIEEDEPDAEEIKICKEYKNLKEDLVPLEGLMKELNLDGKLHNYQL